MIIANHKKVELTVNKKELVEDLENIFMVLTIATDLFTVKEIIHLLKGKRKRTNRFVEYCNKRKRMKELDVLFKEIRRKRR